MTCPKCYQSLQYSGSCLGEWEHITATCPAQSFYQEGVEELVDPLLKVLAIPGRIYQLTKTKSTRPNYMVDVGMTEIGDLAFVPIPAVKDRPTYGVRVQGPGFNYIRTSPVVKILGANPHAVTFQTEGGEYVLEVYSEPLK